MAHWKERGLVPGAGVRMRSVNELDNVYEIEIGGSRLVTGSDGLEGVWIEAEAKG